MKPTFMVLAFACLLLSAPTFANANNEENISYKAELDEDQTLLVRLWNLQRAPTKLVIKNLRGETYFKDWITKHNGYAKKINLQQLPNGKYTISVKNGDTTIVQVLVVDNGKIQLSRGIRT